MQLCAAEMLEENLYEAGPLSQELLALAGGTWHELSQLSLHMHSPLAVEVEGRAKQRAKEAT